MMNLTCSNIDKKIYEFICYRAKGRSRNCVRNSIYHLEKALEIKSIDPEMATFRAITAEEEAATAIFIALKEIGYENANKLEFKNHIHKQAVRPFLQAVLKAISDFIVQNNYPLGEKATVGFRKDENGYNPRIIFTAPNGELVFLNPPLNFAVKTDHGFYNFEHELNSVTSSQNRNEIKKHIEKLAKLRNTLIYAATEGIPRIEKGLDIELENRKKTVLILIRIFSLIFPYRTKALFVQQTLDSFLYLLGKIEPIIEENA